MLWLGGPLHNTTPDFNQIALHCFFGKFKKLTPGNLTK
jgi:hypothetical protein